MIDAKITGFTVDGTSVTITGELLPLELVLVEVGNI